MMTNYEVGRTAFDLASMAYTTFGGNPLTCDWYLLDDPDVEAKLLDMVLSYPTYGADIIYACFAEMVEGAPKWPDAPVSIQVAFETYVTLARKYNSMVPAPVEEQEPVPERIVGGKRIGDSKKKNAGHPVKLGQPTGKALSAARGKATRARKAREKAAKQEFGSEPPQAA